MIQIVLHDVLLVEDLEVLHMRRYGMLPVFNTNGVEVRSWVRSVITAKKFVVESVGRIQRLSVVQREVAASLVYEVP